MKLRRYCVTIMDNWTAMRTFWTLDGAKRFYQQHSPIANIFRWDGKTWQWMCGSRDLRSDG